MPRLGEPLDRGAAFQQLADFQARLPALTSRNIFLVAASADGRSDAQQSVDAHKLTFPIADDLSVPDVGKATGAFVNTDRGLIHATGFILDPAGQVAAAVYSTGVVGRYTPVDCLAFIATYEQKQ